MRSVSVYLIILVQFGLFHSIRFSFSPLRCIKAYFGPFRSTSVYFGPLLSIWSIQSISVHFGSFSVYFGPFSPIRSNSIYFSPLRSIGSIWSISVYASLLGHIGRLRSLWSISVYLVQYGPLRFNLVPSTYFDSLCPFQSLQSIPQLLLPHTQLKENKASKLQIKETCSKGFQIYTKVFFFFEFEFEFEIWDSSAMTYGFLISFE